MKKEDFSFVKWLTKKDVKNILNNVGIELVEDHYNNNGKLVKSISKFKEEDGKTSVVVRCRFIENLNNSFKNDDDKINLSSKLKTDVALIAMFSTLFGASSFSKYDSMMMLKLEDFFCYEILSIKSEEDEINFGRMLTKNYQEYMTKKFGDFYNCKKLAYIKKLNKEAKEQEQEQENL